MAKLHSPATRAPDALWYTRSSVPTILGIAAQLDALKEEFSADGFAVRSLQESNNPAARVAHIDHHLANCVRQGGSVPALWARAEGADTRVIGLAWTEEFQVVLALPGTGIRSARDLRGRRLGLPLWPGEPVDMARASALRGLLAALELEGVSYREVEFVDVPALAPALPDQQRPSAYGVPAGHWSKRNYSADIQALMRREVDAIYVKGVRGVEAARLLGAHVVADIGGHPDLRVRSNNGTPRLLTVSAGLLREHPDIVLRFLARLHATADWAAANPVETLALLSRETGAGEDWVRYAYGSDVHDNLRIDMAEFAIAALEDYKNFLFQWGFLRQNFNLRAWLVPEPLAELRHRLRRKAV